MSANEFGDYKTNQFSKIPFSVLDLSPVNQDSTAAESFRKSLALAQNAENLGFNRFWLAEHHNMTGIASAATSVVIGYIAAGTTKSASPRSITAFPLAKS